MLYVGNLIPRKNLPRLLAAWSLVATQFEDLSLVLVGTSNGVFRNPRLGPLPTSVVPVGYVNDEHLPAVYGGAELFAFPRCTRALACRSSRPWPVACLC